MSREELIQNIKDVGQSLIDNAEQIASDYKFLRDITITCYVTEEKEPPYISVTTDFVPENFISRIYEA